jgi:hypothetical protein
MAGAPAAGPEVDSSIRADLRTGPWPAGWYVVVGPGRSGSTVLDRLLAERGVVAVGELVHLWQRIGVENQLCGCGRPGRTCPFWSAVLTDALGPDWPQRCAKLEAERLAHGTWRSWPAMVLTPDRWARSVAALIEATARVVEAIEARTGSEVVVWDASKSATQARLLTLAGAAPTVVLLTRHPAAVAHSWGRPKPRPEAGGRPMPRHGVVGSSLRWSFAVISGLVEAVRRGQRPPLVEYPTLGTVVDAIAGPPAASGEDASIDGATGTDAGAWVHAVGGNPVRWSGAPLRFVADERWRAVGSPLDRYRATALAGPGLLVLAVARRLAWCRPVTGPAAAQEHHPDHDGQ